MTESEGEAPRSGRGGKRVGAGRKKKGHTSPTALSDVDLRSLLAQPTPDEIETVAQAHAKSAIATLAKQMIHGLSDQARINACNALLDRGFGKPSVDVGGDTFLPFLGVAPSKNLPKEIREDARKYAPLAIEVLNKIASSGASESSRVTAAKSLLDRGLGTVAMAKVTEERFRRPLGKKEEANNAAREAASGRYATPAPPRVLQ